MMSDKWLLLSLLAVGLALQFPQDRFTGSNTLVMSCLLSSMRFSPMKSIIVVGNVSMTGTQRCRMLDGLDSNR